jgi:hypothetical protein
MASPASVGDAPPPGATGVPATSGATGPAGPHDSYVDGLVRRAIARGLYGEPQWLRLGHYRLGSFAEGFESEADGSGFFLSKRGKEDARAELVATLRGLFLPAVEEKPDATGPVVHPLCRFPARAHWLQKTLDIDPARLPVQRCPRFVKFLQEVNPKSATLLFSSYYLNNPASAFGHTFLRFDKAGAGPGRRELLDHAVDFSADVDTGNAIIYGIRGLLGLFRGTAKRMPYYYKVRKYADHESRDMWEYELNLTPEQLYMLVAHVWELGSTYFAYYYLDENCSYRIQKMIEVARPDAQLVDPMTSPILPADTVKLIVDSPGLVRRVSYRPSLRTAFLHAVKDLDGDERDAVEALADDPEAVVPEAWPRERRVRVFDATADLMDMRDLDDIVLHPESEAARDKRRVLERRAAIPVPSDAAPIEPPWDKAPERGHASKRFGFGGGARSPEDGFLAVDFRLAMHDLTDPSDGFPELSQLEFLPTRVRVWPVRRPARLTLDDFAIVKIVSLTSLNRFSLSPSWRFSVGARTLENAGCAECLATYAQVGVGPTVTFADDALALFAFLDTHVLAGDGLAGIADTVARAGFGPSGGVRWRLDPDLIALGRAEWTWFPTQGDPRVWRIDATVRWSYATDQAISVEGRAFDDRLEAQLLLLLYL